MSRVGNAPRILKPNLTSDNDQNRLSTPIHATHATRIQPSDDRFAAELRGFGPIGILAILVGFAANLLFVPAQRAAGSRLGPGGRARPGAS